MATPSQLAPARIMGDFHLEGCWQIISSTYNIYKNYEVGGLQGGVFILHFDGRITWFVPTDNIIKRFHLLHTKLYSTYYLDNKRYIRFSGYGNMVLECELQTSPSCSSIITLWSKEWGYLRCNKFVLNYNLEQFNFLNMIDEEFLSDVTIVCKNRRKFQLHQKLLNVLGRDIPWNDDPTPFTGLPEDVVYTIVYWLYAECLPVNLTEDVASQVIQAVKEYTCMSKLSETCQIFMSKLQLKNKLIATVSDIQHSLNSMMRYFKSFGPGIRVNPAKLCLALKQTAREMSVVALKFVILCDLTEKNCAGKYVINPKSQLEKHEILQYTYLSMPKIAYKLRLVLHKIKETLSPLSHSEKWDIATYFVPEIETGLETVSTLLFEIITAFEQKLKVNSKLHSFQRKISRALFELLEQKKLFAEMTEHNKIRSVYRILDQIIDELPVLLIRLHQIVNRDLHWDEYKLCFDVVTKKMSSIMTKLFEHKEEFSEVFEKVCTLVQKRTFTMDVLNVGLLDIINGLIDYNNEVCVTGKQTGKAGQISMPGFELDMMSFFNISPSFEYSDLSRESNKLLNAAVIDTDVIFEIPIKPVPENEPTASKTSTKKAHKSQADKAGKSRKNAHQPPPLEEVDEGTTSARPNDVRPGLLIKAHRTVVAARCGWFRRALRSGMKEAIDSHIMIHDTTQEMFEELLYYIYTGYMNPKIICPYKLTELMLLADRFELDSMKLDCEIILATRHLHKHNVFRYLKLADNYNAQFLRGFATDFIAKHPKLGNDIIPTLSAKLMAEIKEKRVYHSSFKRKEDALEYILYDQHYDNSKPPYEELIDKARLEHCISHLQSVIRKRVPLEELKRLILDSHFDVIKAINLYYFSMKKKSS